MGCMTSKEARKESVAPVVARPAAAHKAFKYTPKDQEFVSESLARYLRQNYEAVFSNNKLWINEQLASDKGFFTNLLTASQTPDYLYIGCADSLVPANEVMGLDAGQVFIHRNVANIVPNTDLNAMSVVEYAIVRLRVKHVIVCGHYDCGGVQAALEAHDMDLLNPWLRNVRDVYRLHEAELEKIQDEGQRNRRLIEFNAIEQARNVIKTAAVQKSYYEYGYPQVHALVFDLATGELKDLKLDFEATLLGIKKIYNLDNDIRTEISKRTASDQ